MGVVEEPAELLDKNNLGDVAGPFVHLKNFDGRTYEWFATVLLACKTTNASSATLSYTNEGDTRDVNARVLLEYDGWSILRFELRTHASHEARELSYNIKVDLPSGNIPSGKICIQARGKAWHVAGYSCNDQRQYPKVGTACWEKFKDVHRERPLHLVLGTGDQLYNDNVFNGPLIKQWIDIEDKKTQRSTRLSEQQIAEVKDFYFYSYMRWLKYHPAAEQLAGIPQMNTWDDHDIFDGYGSYPDDLQTCPAFKAIFGEAKTMYDTFQLHTNESLYKTDEYISGSSDNGCSWITQLGPNLAVAALDTRAGRSRARIIDPVSIDALFDKIRALPNTVKHILLVSAVPVLYPEIEAAEGFMKSLESRKAIGTKTGLYNGLMNEFGEPELLDDILDHWSSNRHVDEKGRVLDQLRQIAKEKNVRVTLMSGDVHLCAFGFASSSDDNQALAQDPGFIPQVISSAIAYGPPPDMILRALDYYAKKKSSKPVFKGTHPLFETMGWLFKSKDSRMGFSPRFCNRNNFVEFEIQEDEAPMLNVTWHVRKGEGTEKSDLVKYTLAVPPVLKNDETQKAQKLQEKLSTRFFPEPSSCCFCC